MWVVRHWNRDQEPQDPTKRKMSVSKSSMQNPEKKRKKKKKESIERSCCISEARLSGCFGSQNAGFAARRSVQICNQAIYSQYGRITKIGHEVNNAPKNSVTVIG